MSFLYFSVTLATASVMASRRSDNQIHPVPVMSFS